MTTATEAAATVDSATTQQPTVDPQPTDTWTSAQLEQWNRTGEIPKLPTKQDSAPADKAAPDSAPDKKDKTAASASDSATDNKDQKPHLKTKEDTEKRFKELLESNQNLQRQLDELKTAPAKRDDKQVSQPAAEAKVPPLKQFLKDFFAKAENKGKEYEDGVEAWTSARDTEKAKQLEASVRQQIANENAQKALSTSVEEAKKRYPDFDMEKRILPATAAIAQDAAIPFAVKEMINGSPVFVDLMYTLSDPAALRDLIQTAKTNPAAAIRKIVLTEQLVQAELAKANGKGAAGDKTTDAGGDGKTRDASGKFVSSDGSNKDKSSDGASAEPKPRAPKPPAEVGGRGAATEDAATAAARNGNFAAFEAEQNRKARAALS